MAEKEKTKAKVGIKPKSVKPTVSKPTKSSAGGKSTVQKIIKTIKSTKAAKAFPLRAKLMVSIVNSDTTWQLKEIIDDCSCSLSYTFAGTGTAHSAVLDYLGIGATEKAVVLSLIPESDELVIMRTIREKFSLYLAGRGISFTVPLTGVSQIIANGITSAAANKTMDGSKVMKREDRKFDLIIAAVKMDFVEAAMTAARAAGAAGGTIIRSRTLKNTKAEQFIGITLVREQEILMILSKKENTLNIMNALSESVGVKTEAEGVIFSLPVDRTAGISAAEEDYQTEKKDEPHADKKEEAHTVHTEAQPAEQAVEAQVAEPETPAEAE